MISPRQVWSSLQHGSHLQADASLAKTERSTLKRQQTTFLGAVEVPLVAPSIRSDAPAEAPSILSDAIAATPSREPTRDRDTSSRQGSRPRMSRRTSNLRDPSRNREEMGPEGAPSGFTSALPELSRLASASVSASAPSSPRHRDGDSPALGATLGADSISELSLGTLRSADQLGELPSSRWRRTAAPSVMDRSTSLFSQHDESAIAVLMPRSHRLAGAISPRPPMTSHDISSDLSRSRTISAAAGDAVRLGAKPKPKP